MTIDLTSGWSVQTNSTANTFFDLAPATLPSPIGSASPTSLDDIVRFVTEQGTTLSFDGDQYFGLEGFSLGASVPLSLAQQGFIPGKPSFSPLTLSFGDAALNPTLFQDLAAGTAFKEIDVLGYQSVGGTPTLDLVSQDSFASVLGGALTIDQSGLATYVADAGAIRLSHSTIDPNGAVSADPSGSWSVLTSSSVVAGVSAGPATLPAAVASAGAGSLDTVVRFITEQGTTLTLDGAQFFGLTGYSFGATQSESLGAQPGAGTASFDALSLSLDAAGLNAPLFQMLAAGAAFKEIDVLGYERGSGGSTLDLVAQDSFGTVLGGTLSIGDAGIATYVADYGTLSLHHSSFRPDGSLTADPSGSWSVVSNNTAGSFGATAPATLPGTIAPASSTSLDEIVRFITAQGATLTLDGAQFFGLDGFSFAATQSPTIGASISTGKVGFSALTLSLGDAALDPTLFQDLAAGTAFKEIDVLGYQPSGAHVDLVLQDSFGAVLGGTLGIDQSGLATYVADYGTLSLQHSTISPDGSVASDPYAGWSVVNNTTVSGFGATAPSALPTIVAPAGPETLKNVVRFITAQNNTLTVDGASYVALDGFSVDASQPVSVGAQGLVAGRVNFGALTLSLGDAALNPTLFHMLAAGTPFQEIDVLGYQQVGSTNTADLVAQESFGPVGGATLNIDQFGHATYVAQYATIALDHSTINPDFSVSADAAGGWSAPTNTSAIGFGTPGPATLPGTIADISPPLREIVRFITSQGQTLTIDGAQYFALRGFGFGATQPAPIVTQGVNTGKASFGALTLSLDDPALNPTLFQMLASGTSFKEVDILGYDAAGGRTAELLSQDSFGTLVGTGLNIDQSGTATFVAQYATLALQTSTIGSDGLVTADPAQAWSVQTNTSVNGFGTPGPATLPGTIASGSTLAPHDVVRFITHQDTTLSLDGDTSFGLDGFSFAVAQAATIGSQGPITGKAVFGGLTLSLGDAALNPTLFQTLTEATQLGEIDVLTYADAGGTGTQDLVLRDSFRAVEGGALSIDQSGLATYVAQYATLALGADSNAVQTACFASGTNILTTSGEAPVEALRGGVASVRWLGHRRVDCARHPRPRDIMPVRVLADAFAPGQPRRDLLLSPDHAVFVDGVLIPVRYLLNGATIVQQTVQQVTYWHVELDRHDVLLAEGLPCESYLDTGNRAAFANAGDIVTLHPEFAPPAFASPNFAPAEFAATELAPQEFARRIWQRESCAPLVMAGAELASVRARLLARAAAPGFTPTTDPDLHLRAGRARRHPHAVAAGLHRFTLPRGAGSVVLASRAAVPAEIAVTHPDSRRLGIAIARILLDDAPVPLDDARLGAGWHAIEPDGAGRTWRWTNGAAQLDATGARTLAIEVAMTQPAWERQAPPARRRRSPAKAGARARR